MKKKSLLGFASAVGIAIAVGIGSPALASTGQDPEQGQEIRFGHSLEDSTLVGITGEQAVSPFLLDPIDVLNCEGPIPNSGHVVKEYEILYPYQHTDGSDWIDAGSIDLKCGTPTTSGWTHIQARHQYSTATHPNSWETIRSAAISVGANPSFAWDDYMDHAVEDTLDFPLPFPQDIGSNKACFSTIFYIWVGEEPVHQWYVNTITSTNNDLIITAYPSDDAWVNDCVD